MAYMQNPYTMLPPFETYLEINQRTLRAGEVEEPAIPYKFENVWIVPNTGRVFYDSHHKS